MDMEKMLREGKLPPGALNMGVASTKVPVQHQHNPTLDVSDAMGFQNTSPAGVQLITMGGCSNVEIIAREVYPAMLEATCQSGPKLSAEHFHHAASLAVEAAVALKVALQEEAVRQSS